MKTNLNIREMLSLGFMAFALFLGAGNIIFPPFIGMQAGSHVWTAVAGFMLTGVGLPVIAVIALARSGGDLEEIISPVGKLAGNILIIACYLCIGPLFASPRTATVSYELGIAPFTAHSDIALYIYSFLYFAVAALISLYPGRLLESVGQFLAPLKIISLIVLAIAIFTAPDVPLHLPKSGFVDSPFSGGIVNGYLTMDTLAGLAFGLVVVNAIRSRGINKREMITRYTARAGIMAGAGLIAVYLSLFILGLKSVELAPDAKNGADILQAFVSYIFGTKGVAFLGVMISVACIVTAIGLTCSCASYFSSLTPFGYRPLVLFFAGLSFVISCAGLDKLIHFSIPVLIAVYPPFIVLIIAGFFKEKCLNPVRIIAPATGIAFVCGVFDGLWASNIKILVPLSYRELPLFEQQMAWITPTILTLIFSFVIQQLTVKKGVRRDSL